MAAASAGPSSHQPNSEIPIQNKAVSEIVFQNQSQHIPSGQDKHRCLDEIIGNCRINNRHAVAGSRLKEVVSSGRDFTQRFSPVEAVTAVVTCEGDLHDPLFAGRWARALRKLEKLLLQRAGSKNNNNNYLVSDSAAAGNKGKQTSVITVRKLEPWNSVRVTLSLPRDAAQRLRQLAAAAAATATNSDGGPSTSAASAATALAAAAEQLRQLGILSVQLEGDQVFSLRTNNAPTAVATTTADSTQDTAALLLRDASLSQDGASISSSSSSSSGTSSLSQLLSNSSVGVASSSGIMVNASNSLSSTSPTSSSSSSHLSTPSCNATAVTQQFLPETLATTVPSDKVQFRSPNVVCPPPDIAIMPKTPATATAPPGAAAVLTNNSASSPVILTNSIVGGGVGVGSAKAAPGPFPFTSMNQAIHTSVNRGGGGGGTAATAPVDSASTNFAAPPPPYPGKQSLAPPPPPPPVTLSSPLLVNLLQNDGATTPNAGVATVNPQLCKDTTNRQTVVPSANINNNIAKSAFPAAVTAAGGGSSAVDTTSASGLAKTLMYSNDIANCKQYPLSVEGSKPPAYPDASAQTQFYNERRKAAAAAAAAAAAQANATMAKEISSIAQALSKSGSNFSRSIQQQQQQQQLDASFDAFNHKALTPHLGVGDSASTMLNNNNIMMNNSTVFTNTAHDSSGGYAVAPPTAAASVAQVQPSSSSNPVPYNHPYNPPPPAYPTSSWSDHQDSGLGQPLQELQPSLAELKADLEHLLPSLECDLAAGSPSLLCELADDLIASTTSPIVTGNRESTPQQQMISAPPPDTLSGNYLINPLTGELEPQIASDGEQEEECKDVFTDLPSPNNLLSDEDTNSTIRPDTTTDQSDSESRSCHSDSSKHSKMKGRSGKEKGRDSPNITNAGSAPIAPSAKHPTEKIKLRLKLEKSEPVSPAYKVDVSFINTQQPKRAAVAMGVNNTTMAVNSAPPTPGSAEEQPRVPPLHISLRGRNHAVINNKKKVKLNADGTPLKINKQKKIISATSEHVNSIGGSGVTFNDSDEFGETKKLKKPKLNHEIKDKMLATLADMEHEKLMYNFHYKEKLKERRGSDSELGRAKKFAEMPNNGAILASVDKKRRLSQSEDVLEDGEPAVLGSTNVGTVASISNSHKPRKELKYKLKEGGFKSKDLNRLKSYSKNIADKMLNSKQAQVVLPTGEIDMEAKFKQRLMEDPSQQQRLPHRTDGLKQKESPVASKASPDVSKVEELIQTLSDHPPTMKEKPPESGNCKAVTPSQQTQQDVVQAVDKQQLPVSSRSPPNSGGAQGEDSGIESMDALSEKSPNQASQSPHADLVVGGTGNVASGNSSVGCGAGGGNGVGGCKPQVPDMLDIEAQLAKMEGLNGEEDETEEVDDHEDDVDRENMGSNRNVNTVEDSGGGKLDESCNKLEQRCGALSNALQDSLTKGTVSLTQHPAQSIKEQMPQVEVSLVPIKSKKDVKHDVILEEDTEPLPVRVTPPLYTYSNPEKRSSDSPTLGLDSDNSNSSRPSPSPPTSSTCVVSTSISTVTTSAAMNAAMKKSLLEQLLIEIPESGATPSSPSPATRSLRTRATSKLNSPELLNSPSSNPKQGAVKQNVATAGAGTPAGVKRKRNESDSSNASVDNNVADNGQHQNFNMQQRNKKSRKCSENAAELIKACMGLDKTGSMGGTGGNVDAHLVKRRHPDESSDSDEPLIEVAGKAKKGGPPVSTVSGQQNNLGSSNGTNMVTAPNRIKMKASTVSAVAVIAAAASVGGQATAPGMGGGMVNATPASGATVSTRRSIRTVPALNTRSKGDKGQPESDTLRRKTRSAVSESDGKRRKDVK